MPDYVLPVVIAFVSGYVVCLLVSIPGWLKRRRLIKRYQKQIAAYRQAQQTMRRFMN